MRFVHINRQIGIYHLHRNKSDMTKKKIYTFVDLFAGCGGLSEGFMQSGHFKSLAHIEWELPMVQTLRNRLVKKWGESVNHHYTVWSYK